MLSRAERPHSATTSMLEAGGSFRSMPWSSVPPVAEQSAADSWLTSVEPNTSPRSLRNVEERASNVCEIDRLLHQTCDGLRHRRHNPFSSGRRPSTDGANPGAGGIRHADAR